MAAIPILLLMTMAFTLEVSRAQSAIDVMPCRVDSVRAWPAQKEVVQCGIANHLNGRIESGSEIQPNEFPWLAFLTIYFWNGDAAHCGATLISDRWILTAAHCTYGAVSINVTLGAHDVSLSSSDAFQQMFSTRKWIAHPSFAYGDVENDLALIEVPQSISLSDYIRPACLPYSDDPDQIGDAVMLVGWGNYSSTANYFVPRKALTSVISSSGTNGSCQQQSGVGAFSGDKIICGDGSSGRRYCYGDDGGPMSYYDPTFGTHSIVGVAWMGESNSNCQTSRLPNIYTRVRGYLGWIYNNTGIVPQPRPSTTTTTTSTTTRASTVTSTTSRPNGTVTTVSSTTSSGSNTTPDSTGSSPSTLYPYTIECKGKPNGVYPNPYDDCSRIFFMCSNGFAYEYMCPDAGTVFNPELCECDFPTNVPGCAVTRP